MIPRIPHPLTPHHLPPLKQKLPPNLPRRPSTQHIFPRLHFLIETLQYNTPERFLDVGRRFLGTEREGLCHAEFLVESARGVGVDGVGAGCFAHVHGDEVGLAAADYDDRGWGGEGGEEGGGDGGGEGADVFLAVL